MRTQERGVSRSVWYDANGRRTAHLAGHLVQLRQVDAFTLDVCIDGYSRRWSARGRHPLREAERAIMAMLLQRSSAGDDPAPPGSGASRR